MNQRLVAVLLTLSLSLVGCAAVTSVPAGPMALGAGQVTLGRAWSDISLIMPARSKKVHLLSLEGPLLNRLYVTEGMKAGDYMIRPLAKELPTPTVRADMSMSEQIEFLADSVAAMDYIHVETSHPRPVMFGASRGVRIDITAETRDGLEIKGVGTVARDSAGQLYVILYLAPAEYYFDAGLAEVESIIATARAG